MDDRALLARLALGRLSGDALARDFGLTRAAVWKRIQNLRAAGIDIQGRAGEGYGLGYPVELLDRERILAALPAEAAAALDRLEIAWTVESTNTELLSRPVPARGAAVMLAERQTGGRGRRGRQWASPLAAHIYLSVARGFAGGLAQLAGLSLAVGVAAAEALRACGFGEVGLKWPNDLLAGERKLGGLLIEGGGEVGGPARAVIGLGVNVHMPEAFAADIGQPWVDLDTLAGQPVSRNTIVAALLAQLLPALDLFEEQGLAPFLPRYAALDLLAGRRVRIEEAGRFHEGVAEGLAPDGALRVRGESGERLFHAGEVSVRPA
ncbi:bifunctional biotin--[acetyl-CoA-carboxylase] ligase/biotin operon repressor BirA [Stenotrophomonas sp. HITSZ_GD]|uniref:bifunctional biotin--[acetyl-CoA-carboxylase] ligase/biotin operon repressor BirA n=1 Tax=Stenotrophomonas sp. HITSZ_GD TaxID=3037248 RepID=UPI00240DE0D3|nr:bifunctional biotin--[acetyl-CoA-carboxylase] ligase/biotin operon repressor BirA [Stenotrophomonas sp. HITSZ_GD]MDG2523795.1 bifunctional biotin--[acetyl-CoA-carboxylase] ligase/biotin operon repressor BirA [Stenotrophomonas sp. HITSZ_GD]